MMTHRVTRDPDIRRVGLLNTAFFGDLVLCAGAIEALHQQGYAIVLFTNAKCRQVYEGDPRLTKLVVIEKGRSFFQKVRRFFYNRHLLKVEKCDVLLIPHRSFTSALMACGLCRTIGFASFWRTWLYSHTVPWQPHRYEWDRVLDLVSVLGPLPKGFGETLGQKVFLKTTKPPQVLIPQKPYFILSPGAVWATKKYPAHLWAAVVMSLFQKHPQLHCVVSGGPQDVQDVADFFTSFHNLANGADYAHRFPLGLQPCVREFSDLIHLTKGAAFALTHDSAPLHVASALGVPVLALFGPTALLNIGFEPRGTGRVVTFADAWGGPLPCQPCSLHGQNQCPLKHHRCLSALPPQVIVDRIPF